MFFKTSNSLCDVNKIELVETEESKDAFISDEVYLDDSFNLQVSIGSIINKNLFIKASTSFGT